MFFNRRWVIEVAMLLREKNCIGHAKGKKLKRFVYCFKWNFPPNQNIYKKMCTFRASRQSYPDAPLSYFC